MFTFERDGGTMNLIPRCEKCKKEQEPGVIIGKMDGMLLCGECIIDLQKVIITERRKMFLDGPHRS